jgi:hypothetical protein
VVKLWMNGQCFEIHVQLVPCKLMEVTAAQVLLDNDASIDEHDFSDDEDKGGEEGEGAVMEAVQRK